MKINIWIKKEEAISGNITKYYSTEPVSNLKDPDKYETDYVQVSISRDEFAILEDNNKVGVYDLQDMSMKKEDWLVSQYNRNRNPEDFIKSREEIPYIFERNPDNGEVYRRKSGDIKNREQVSMGVGERDYSGEKGLESLLVEVQDKTGGEFAAWFYKLTKNEQTKLSNYYKNN